MGYQNFEELEVWKKAWALKNDIYERTKMFPADEKYRLTDQIIRSARSINAQIVEGHGRRTFPDRLRFCIIARGSLSETINHLFDALDCGYISVQTFESFKQRIIEVERLLNGYISFLEKRNVA